ncbi:MAG: hypothetical protein JNL66_22900 [Alphaproteobacteria bacterium]|nr:hypothetical protein [Alphaproteobacteria bacterium]
MSELRYPARALLGDYLRAGLGLVLTLPPTLAVPAGSIAQYVLGALAILFASFAARTASRQTSRVTLEPARITLSALRRTSLEWADLRAAKLNYYSTRADRGEGWMQLTLKGSGSGTGGTIRVDSNLDGFVEVARAAAAAAQANRVPLSETTRVNFTSLGIAIAEPPPPPDGHETPA